VFISKFDIFDEGLPLYHIRYIGLSEDVVVALQD